MRTFAYCLLFDWKVSRFKTWAFFSLSTRRTQPGLLLRLANQSINQSSNRRVDKESSLARFTPPQMTSQISAPIPRQTFKGDERHLTVPQPNSRPRDDRRHPALILTNRPRRCQRFSS